MGNIHYREHLPTNKRQLSGLNDVWLNVAYSEIYFPSKNNLPYLFRTVRSGGNAHLSLAKPEFMITLHARHHGCMSANKVSCTLVKHPPPGPLGEGPGHVNHACIARDCPCLASRAVPGPHSAGTLEGSRSG